MRSAGCNRRRLRRLMNRMPVSTKKPHEKSGGGADDQPPSEIVAIPRDIPVVGTPMLEQILPEEAFN